MKLKKLLCLALASMIPLSVISNTGCFGGATVDVNDLNVPTYQDAGETVLRVDLPPNQADREQMLLYKECGFNAIPLTDDFCSSSEVAPYMEELAVYKEELAKWDGVNPATKPVEPEKPAYVKALELCEELDIDVYIRPHSDNVAEFPETMFDENGVAQKNYFEERFYNFNFKDYPAVKGFMMCDEPTYGKLTDMQNRYIPWFNENYGDAGYEVLINHLSPGASLAWKDKYSSSLSYDDYIGHFYDDVLGPAKAVNKVFSHDGYVLNTNGVNNYIDERHLFSGVRMRQYADEYGVDYGAYIQCFHGHDTLRPMTSYADFSFQVCTYLALGAKVLSFYGYRDYPPENHLMSGGDRTEKWYWVKEVNQMIKKIDGIIYNFDWQGLFTNVGTGGFYEEVEHFNAIKEIDLDKLDGVKTFKSKYNAIVGQFEDPNGNKGFMLVNYEEPSITHTNKVTMEFENADGVLLYRNGDPTVLGLTDKTFTIDLDAGEGVFIVPLFKK